MLAAAHETGVITALEQALLAGVQADPRLAHATQATRHQSLLTLLFLGVVGLRRPWELRGYTGEALALLTGRRRAYGYFQCERFLAQVSRDGGDETLTEALAQWTARLWLKQAKTPDQPPSAFYLDGHKKPVYTDHLIPRGLIGRTGKILSCRALLLLNDAKGHPLFATTPRQVLISTDADGAGDKAADWWLAHLPAARRWRPVIKDPTEMHRLGFGLREWVADALDALRPPPAPKLQVIAGNPAAVRKIALDPDAQPRLEIVRPAQPTRCELSPRAQVLLEGVPEEMRGWNVCFEAAQHYAAANEPAYIIDFWGRGKQTHQHKPLWTLLGLALATRGALAHAAIDLLNRMRSQL